jgi:hypothetical protein
MKYFSKKIEVQIQIILFLYKNGILLIINKFLKTSPRFLRLSLYNFLNFH